MTWSPREPDRHTTCTPLDTRGPKRLWNEPAGVVTREPGDLDRLVTREYLCPVHGRFEAQVSRADIPDEMPCPVDTGLRHDFETTDDAHHLRTRPLYCGVTAPWSPSASAALWKSTGEIAG